MLQWFCLLNIFNRLFAIAVNSIATIIDPISNVANPQEIAVALMTMIMTITVEAINW